MMKFQSFIFPNTQAPLLATIPGIGSSVAALVIDQATGTSTQDDDEAIAQRWLAVQALPNACASPKQLQAMSLRALHAAAAVAGAASSRRELLGQCWRVVASCVSAFPASQLRTLDTEALQCAAMYPQSAAVLAGVALYMTTRSHTALPDNALLVSCVSYSVVLAFFSYTTRAQTLLPALQPSLAAPNAVLRISALDLLCALPQPPAPTAPESEIEPMPSTVLHAIRDACGAKQSLEGGRAAALALGQVQHALEYGRVPVGLRDAVVLGLLGTLHIRYAMRGILIHNQSPEQQLSSSPCD